MRPQFGSPPFHEDFTSALLQTASATFFASRCVRAPFTFTVTNFVTRSPSRTTALASSSITHFSASRNCLQAEPLRRAAGIPLAPFASTITVSLVLMSPSMVIRLKLSSTASSTARWRQSRERFASVVMKQSIVAMLGEIMPAPFTQPPIRTRCSPISKEIATSFSCVSLVMIALAKSLPLFNARPSTSCGMCGVIRAIGIGRPITPVEQTPTSVRFRPRPFATSSHMEVASCMPRKPVQALALPEFTITARRLPFRR